MVQKDAHDGTWPEAVLKLLRDDQRTYRNADKLLQTNQSFHVVCFCAVLFAVEEGVSYPYAIQPSWLTAPRPQTAPTDRASRHKKETTSVDND